MELTVDSDQRRGAGACVADAEVGSLNDAELVERMAELGRERCRVEGQLAEIAAEMHRRNGGRGAAALMRERLRVSARQATAERGHQDVSSQQRRADALANLITGEGPHQRPKVTLLMIADYETVTCELRPSGGTLSCEPDGPRRSERP